MPSLRSISPIILPLALGIGLLWGLSHWKPLSPLAKIEHSLFIFPERFEPETIYPDRGNLSDFKVTPLDFTGDKSSRSLGSYLIDDQTRDIIDLTPEKWAYLLETIRNNSEGLLVITEPLSWPDATELSLQTLDHQISQTPDIVIGLDAEFNNTQATLPPFLESSVISPTTPDFLHLPKIDFLTLPPSIKAPLFGISTIQGFVIETPPSGLKIPMLVNWGESILPSTHLASLIAAHQLTPADVLTDTSGYLRLGPEGSIIKIDTQGRATFPTSGNETLSASQILIDPETATSSKIILAQNAPQFLSLLETHITEALSQNPRPLKTYQRWTLPIEIAGLILLTLLLQARRLWLSLLGIAAIFAVSVYLNHWFLSSPVALLIASFAILPKSPPKKIEPPKNENPPPPESKPKSEPKPDPQPKPKSEPEPEPKPKNTPAPQKNPPPKKTAKKAARKSAKKAARKQGKRKKKKRR